MKEFDIDPIKGLQYQNLHKTEMKAELMGTQVHHLFEKIGLTQKAEY